MIPALTEIRRHPIKGIGSEVLETAELAPDRPLGGDRAWAMLQQGQSDTGTWQRRGVFLQCASGPGLMAITAMTHQDQITLTHPERPEVTIAPARDIDQAGQELRSWIAPIWPTDRPAPDALIAAPAQGMSDADFPSVSLMNFASLRALSDFAGQSLDQRRFRGNLWIDGVAPWAELDWVGKTLRIGDVECEVVEPIQRCRATEANPETGARDVNVLAALRDGFDHLNFGINLRVKSVGRVNLGDEVIVL